MGVRLHANSGAAEGHMVHDERAQARLDVCRVPSKRRAQHRMGRVHRSLRQRALKGVHRRAGAMQVAPVACGQSSCLDGACTADSVVVETCVRPTLSLVRDRAYGCTSARGLKQLRATAHATAGHGVRRVMTRVHTCACCVTAHASILYAAKAYACWMQKSGGADNTADTHRYAYIRRLGGACAAVPSQRMP